MPTFTTVPGTRHAVFLQLYFTFTLSFIIFSPLCFLLGGELSISKAVKTCIRTSVDDRVHTNCVWQVRLLPYRHLQERLTDLSCVMFCVGL
jgi:hypothetical protein